MGIYLNPDNENFKEIVNAKIYVDKSMMIETLEHIVRNGNKYICISRPRRFGKTVAGNMLAAFYSKGCDSTDLFCNLKISETEIYAKKRNRCNVIQIDMNSEYQNAKDKSELINRITEKIKSELRIEFPVVDIQDEDSLADSILKIYTSDKTQTFIIILDEYDVLVREQVDKELFGKYLSFLNGLFKSNTVKPAIAMAYLTGILPIVRDKIQSKLNNFREYTIIKAGALAEYIGFTSEEVRCLCEQYDMDYEECKRWYDGYSLQGMELYNPESVICSIDEGEYGSYWGQTSSYEVISDRIRENFVGTRDAVIRMMAGESVGVNVTRYLNTMDSFGTTDDVLTYLIHLGYLAYDREHKKCRIPNREVRQEWENALLSDKNYETTNRIIAESEELLHETWKGNEDAVAKALDESYIHVTSNRSYNNEDALQSAIYLAYLYALNQYNVFREMTTGKGFADVVYVPVTPDLPAMIIELKHNGTVESAIDQIRTKKYYDSLEHYKGDLLFVGINYDEKEKTHSCKIERFVK